MITELLLAGLFGSITLILGILPNIPSMPFAIADGIDKFLNIIFGNVGLLNAFIPITTIKIVIPLVIIIVNFDYIYKIAMWILKKIPALSVSD